MHYAYAFLCFSLLDVLNIYVIVLHTSSAVNNSTAIVLINIHETLWSATETFKMKSRDSDVKTETTSLVIRVHVM